MDLLHALRTLACVSEYEPREIDDSTLAAIVEAAAWAPSAADAQPWEIVAVRDPERRAALAGTLLNTLMRAPLHGTPRRHWLVQAPLVLVVCLDRMRAKARYGEIGDQVFGVQDTGAAMQNIRLAALDRGIKSCLLREFDHAAAAALLALPRHVEPLTLITLGYSQIAPVPKHCLPLSDYLHRETWSG